MDQMTVSTLNMASNTAKPETEQKTGQALDGSEKDAFRQALESARKQPKDRAAQNADSEGKAEVSEPAQDAEKMDPAVLSQLAAMQCVQAETVQILVPASPANAEPQLIVQSADLQMQGEQLSENSAKQTTVAAEQTTVAAQTQTAQAPAAAAEKQSNGAQSEMQQSLQQSAHPAEKQEETQLKNVEGETLGTESRIFRQLETAPIKVSDAAAPAEAKSMAAQIADKLAEAMPRGETRVEVQLTPEHLGKITVELRQRDDGSLHILLHAENSQTRLLLEKDLGGLQMLLHRNTNQDVQVEVPRQQEAQQDMYREDRQEQGHGQRQQQQEKPHSSDDFLQQLRLGLIPAEEAAS